MRTRGVAVLLLLAAAMAAAWALRRGASDHPPVDAVEAPDGAPRESRPAPSLAAPDARPAPGVSGPKGRLVGTVRRAGRPVAARVEVRWRASLERFDQGHTLERTLADDLRPMRAGGPAAVGRAGADGRYAIDAPTGRLDVTAIAEDGARGRTDAHLPTAGQRVTADVEVAPACDLSGRARYADGRPFRGIVVVRPAGTWGPMQEEEAVATDGDGRFHVAGLLAGAQGTRFVVPGEALYYVSGPVLPTSETWDVVVDADAATLEGRVLEADDDAPIEGATVLLLSSQGGRSVSTRVRSARDGGFRATRLGTSEWYGLYVSAPGHAPKSVEGTPASQVTVRLVRAASLAGTVRRAAGGTAVAGARVRVVVAEGVRWMNPLAETTADADGRYAIEGLAPLVVSVFASAPGLSMALDAPEGWSRFAVPLVPGGRVERDVDLVDGGVLFGRVLDADGVPVAGAIVGVSSLEGTEPGRVDPAFPDRSCAAADDGTFRLEGLVPGLLTTLAATAPAYGTATSVPTLATPSPVGAIEIRFAPVCRVVVLSEPEGAPVAGAAVRYGTESATTDAAGRVSIPGPRERETPISIRAAGYVPVHRVLEQGATSVEVRLARGLALTGHVVRADGAPASHARVWARPGGDHGHTVDASADADGAFTLPDLPDGAIDVGARSDHPDGRYEEAKATGRPGTPLTLRLGPAPPSTDARPSSPSRRILLLRVLDPAGRPVERADASFRRRRDAGVTWLQVRGGEARHASDPGEAGTFEVWNARDEYGRSLGLAPGRVEAEAGALPVDVRLAPGADLAGRVVDSQGRPMGSVSIEIADPPHAFRVAEHGTAGSNEALARARTGTDGGFRLGGLPHDAELRLLVRPPPGFVRPDPIPVRSGGAPVRVVLSAGVDAVVRVVDAAGASLANALVVIEVVRDGVAVRVTELATDATGRARGPCLDPATPHRLTVRPKPRENVFPFVVDPWTPGDVTVVVPDPLPVEGIVVAPDGSGVDASLVARSPPDAGWHGVACDASGRFRFTTLDARPVRIRVDAEGFVRREVTLVAAKDMAPVRIALERGAVWRFAIGDWPAGRAGGAYLTDESGPPRETDAYGEIDGTGAFTVRGVDPAKRYRVWIPPEDGDGYALARDLEPSDEVTHLAFARGGSIRGTVSLPEGIRSLECRATCDGLFAQGFATPDGAIEVRGLPPGRWTVTVRGRTSLCRWKGSAEASPGDDVRLVLEPTASD